MKQVTNTSIGGRVYALEEDAYVSLQTYLREIENALDQNPDKQEIMSDIETAIAEHIQKNITIPNQPITLNHVQFVMELMGNPESYTPEKEATQTEPQTEQHTTQQEIKPEKKLYRDTENAVLAGVGSGLSVYFGIDVVIVRVLFVIATLFWGWGILAYIILWITMPEAKTVSEKLRMRGTPVTVQKIEEYVYTAAQKAKHHAEGIAESVEQKQYPKEQEKK